jgi:hypothetical protein
MLFGQDYPKITIDCFGLELLEPNAFIGDTLIFIVSLYFAFKIKRAKINDGFHNYWFWFYIVFGVSFFLGGIGHLLYNYLGIPGKAFSWYSGIVACYLLERALLTVYPLETTKKLLILISKSKLFLALLLALFVQLTVDLSVDPQKGMLVPTINSILGLGSALGGLGVFYQKKLVPSFKYLWISALILIPSAAFQLLKISFHQWFDRNDASHSLLIVSLILYYKCVAGFSQTYPKGIIS